MVHIERETAGWLCCRLPGVICRAGGSNLQNVAWTQNLYSRAEDVFPAIEVWNERFPSEPPASLVIGVGRPILAEGCTIYVDAVAVGDA